MFTVCVLMRSYVEKYDLQEPSDDIQHVLKRIAVRLGKTQRVKAITGVGKSAVTTDAAYRIRHSTYFSLIELKK